MSTKDWKNKEIQGLLSEAWGFKMNLDVLTEAKGEKGDADPLDGERAKFDKDHDGVPDGADKDKDDPDVKESMDEGGCPSMDHEGETAMMVVGGEPDMMGDMEMDDNMETSEMRLASLVDRLESLLGKMEGGDMMEDEQLDEEEELEERRGRGRDREGMEPDERRRPMNEQKLREAVRKALKASIKKA